MLRKIQRTKLILSIVKRNKFLADLIENKTKQLLSNTYMETIFIKTGNIKTNEPHKFFVNLSKRLVLKSSNK